jgi:hypothetical protein
MRRSSLVIALLAILVALAFVISESHDIALGRDSLSSEQKRMARLEQQLAELRQQRDDALRQLDVVAQRLASASVDATPRGVSADPARAAAVDSWLSRVKRLKQTFDDHPDQRIPELSLLTDLDWMTLARQQQLDSEEGMRKARAKARDAAFYTFQPSLGQALRDYVAAANGAPLLDLSQLVPYLKPPVDATFLQRYEIASALTPVSRGDRRQITERSPVDEELDIRHTILIDAAGRGNGGGSIPWVIDSWRQASVDALNEFVAANNGQRPKSEADTLPYVHDRAAKAIFEAMIAYTNDHHGQQSSDSTVLRPYVKDPTARVLLEKLISAKQNSDSP